jgi:hypothetical protein
MSRPAAISSASVMPISPTIRASRQRVCFLLVPDAAAPSRKPS